MSNAKKVSVVNMKGGVGKSTLTVNLGWHFCGIVGYNKKVLIVDLDPQFNSPQYLLGSSRYEREIVRSNRPTVWNVFEQATRVPGVKSLKTSIKESIMNVVSYGDGARLDLLPSQIELSNTLKNPNQKEHLLASFIKNYETYYDLILIDCAPTESVLTTAAYLASDFILIPVKPEFLSTIGLPLIATSIDDFQSLYGKKIEVTGICFNSSQEYVPEEPKAKREVKSFAGKVGWHIFDEEIPYSRSFPKGAREGKPIFSTTYSRSSVASRVKNFCDAFTARISL